MVGRSLEPALKIANPRRKNRLMQHMRFIQIHVPCTVRDHSPCQPSLHIVFGNDPGADRLNSCKGGTRYEADWASPVPFELGQ